MSQHSIWLPGANELSDGKSAAFLEAEDSEVRWETHPKPSAAGE
jgi:hypothetical protein